MSQLRPMIALKGSPTYNLAKWMYSKLKFLQGDSTTSVRSASQFLIDLRGRRIQSDKIMVFFDVTSLFTSIPPKMARGVLRKRLEEAYDETRNALKIEHLMRLSEFCQQTFFTFAGDIYEQIKGTPMGSLVSGLVAELILQELEKIAFIKHGPRSGRTTTRADRPGEEKWTSTPLSTKQIGSPPPTKLNGRLANHKCLPHQCQPSAAPNMHRYKCAFRTRLGLVGHLWTQCAINPTTSSSPLTLVPAANPAPTVTASHNVAAPPPLSTDIICPALTPGIDNSTNQRHHHYVFTPSSPPMERRPTFHQPQTSLASSPTAM
ncbi:hypothetical protein SprV_0200576800 [Sparganum proliferum]